MMAKIGITIVSSRFERGPASTKGTKSLGLRREKSREDCDRLVTTREAN